MATVDYEEKDRGASAASVATEAEPVVQDSETLRAQVAREMKMMGQMRSTARPLALVVFVVLGLLAASQFYTWVRLDELTTSTQQREERTALAQATLQESIDRQRAALEQSLQRTDSPGKAAPLANTPEKEIGQRDPAPAGREQPKRARAGHEPRPEPQAAPGTSSSRPASEHVQAPAARQAASGNITAIHQAATAAATPQNPSTARRELTAYNQGSFTPPAGQVPSARQGASGVQGEQREVGETSGSKTGQADTAVAHNHNEIEGLRKLGKRDYVEFTLARSRTRQEVAPDISLQLKKVDAKRSRCALNIYAEGYEFPASLGVNEPMVFPIQAMWESVQLVVTKIGNDDVAGYLSAPKGVLVAGK